MSQRRLPAEVYWRRRLLLLAALILLAWLVVRAWPSGGDDPEPAAAPAPTPSASTPAGASPSPSASTSTGPTATTATVSLATGTEPCDPESLRVVPSVPPKQRAGEAVDVNLVVSSTSAKPCVFRAAQADLLVVISAGRTPVWDSTVCRTALVDEPVVVSPQWASVAVGTWTGRGSGGGCSAKEGWATPGKYRIQAGTLGGEPGKATFRLEQPAPRAKKPTTSTTPSPKPSGSARPSAKPSPKTSATPAD